MEEGHFREVKTGVLLLPEERVETSPGRRPPRRDVVAVHRMLARAAVMHEVRQCLVTRQRPLRIDAAFPRLVLAEAAEAGDARRIATASAVARSQCVGKCSLPL